MVLAQPSAGGWNLPRKGQRNKDCRCLILCALLHYLPLTSKEEEEEDSSPGVSFSLSSEESEMEPEEERIRYSQRLVSVGLKHSNFVLDSVVTEERNDFHWQQG